MIIDSNITRQIDEIIKLKKWDILENALNDTYTQAYYTDKIVLIGLCLLEKLKKPSQLKNSY